MKEKVGIGTMGMKMYFLFAIGLIQLKKSRQLKAANILKAIIYLTGKLAFSEEEREIMTVEQIELRKILSQMLADNGIDKTTISGFVRAIINEKVDRAVEQVISHETNMNYIINNTVKEETKKAIKSKVEEAVRSKLNNMWLNIDIQVEGIDKLN